MSSTFIPARYRWIKNTSLAFASGALAVLIFQLGLNGVLSVLGLSQFPNYPMSPVPPFGVPLTLNWAFWGGIWGVVMWSVVRNLSGASYWAASTLFGILVVTAVLFFVVFPIKGQPIAGGFDMELWVLVMALHGAFGAGCALFLRLFGAANGETEQMH